MNNKTILALSILTAALTLAAPALAQTTPAMPAPVMKMNDTMMKAAPTFAFSTQSGMNMMMNSGGAVAISSAPGEKLVSRSVKGTAATLVYTGKNSASIFAFYDKAIKAEGWKTTAMDGKMMVEGAMMKSGDSMAPSSMASGTMTSGTMAAKPADTMAKPATMNSGEVASGAMMGGTHSATFAMGGHTIDLNVRESAGRVTVTFKSK
ncbi:hypothetical protein [Deinococcus sp. UYEF24]